MNKNVIYLLLICLFDMLSYAIFSPIAAFLFLDGPYTLLSDSNTNRHFLFGLFLCTYSVIQIFSCPFWGYVAEKMGKKTVLSIAFLGNLLGYFCCFFAIYTSNIFFLFLGSSVAGLTGANMSMINAFISSESKENLWSKNYSLFGAVIGFSFIIGPQISAQLLDFFPKNSALLFLLMSCSFLSLLNFCLVIFVLKEKKNNCSHSLILQKSPLLSYKSIFTLSSHVKSIYLFLFFIYLSWFFFIKFFQVYLFDQMSMNEKQCCEMTSFLGLSCSIWQSLRFLYSSSFFESKLCLSICSFIMMTSFLFFTLSNDLNFIFLNILLLSFSYAMIVPSILSILFKIGHESKEYKAVLYQSNQSVAKIIAPLLSGLSFSYKAFNPIFISALFSFVGFLIIVSSSKIFLKDEKISNNKVSATV